MKTKLWEDFASAVSKIQPTGTVQGPSPSVTWKGTIEPFLTDGKALFKRIRGLSKAYDKSMEDTAPAGDMEKIEEQVAKWVKEWREQHREAIRWLTDYAKQGLLPVEEEEWDAHAILHLKHILKGDLEDLMDYDKDYVDLEITQDGGNIVGSLIDAKMDRSRSHEYDWKATLKYHFPNELLPKKRKK